ncbi:hypothetical protein KDC96_12605 [Erythrobacter sp. JK5]|nr:hypothetical protein KDC96_12605 [Erythrobacter sp. JK5]
MAALPASAASAAPDPAAIDLATERTAIGHFQALDQKLQDVGWKLVRGNAPFCQRQIRSIGLQLQDLASYGAPDIARLALGLSGDFAVQTAARGSPAALSGEFTPNREITRLGDRDPNLWEAGERRHWQRLTRAHDWIDSALADGRSLAFGFADGGEAAPEPVVICATRFELAGEGKRAVATGDRVVIGMNFAGFSYAEEIFAGAVAHELAHNLLGHRAWLSEHGRKRRNVRRAEREADRLMPWLMANAGYDPAAAYRFMTTWGPRHDGGLFRARTHDGWDERAEFIAAELPAIAALMEREGKADWSRHFTRDIDPNSDERIASGD